MNFNFPCKRGHSDPRRPEVRTTDPSASSKFVPSPDAFLRASPTGQPASVAADENIMQGTDQGSFGEPSLWRTVDAFGNVFLTDDNLIRRLDSSGSASVLAGSADPGFADRSTALFAYPAGLAADAGGNIFVADTGNHRIRKIDATGQVTTLAGNGQPGYLDGNAATAQFHFPLGITVDDQGNVYVADRSNRRIRKIDPNGLVSTIAGCGTAGLLDGPGSLAQFKSPAGILVDKTGSLYVSDLRSPDIRRIDRNGMVSTLGTTPATTPAPLTIRTEDSRSLP
jgi:sugar lactone lactonase YvrE